MRCGTCAIVGRPNVGKSTLVNALLKSKVAIVSPKPQTTRNAIRCIYNAEDIQIVFVDTPGIFAPKQDDKLGQKLVEAAVEAIDAADVVCYIVAAGDAEDAETISILKKVKTPIILVVNKCDLRDEKNFAHELNFAACVKISAMKSQNLDALISAITPFIPEGEAWYDKDILIDSTERFLAAELIREQILKYLRDEVPHCVAVEIDDYKSPDEYEGRKKLYISARLIVETDGQKAIIIGAGGKAIRKLGEMSRLAIEKSTGHGVFLDLRVQTRAGWRQSSAILKRLGI